MNCQKCGLGLVAAEEARGICAPCFGKMSQDEIDAMNGESRELLNSVMLTTETTLSGEFERVSIIGSEFVVGLNIFKDMFVQIRDVTGGRSGTIERALIEGRASLLDALRKQALDLNCSAVIAVNVSYSQLDSSMLMMAATGTAVRR